MKKGWMTFDLRTWFKSLFRFQDVSRSEPVETLGNSWEFTPPPTFKWPESKIDAPVVEPDPEQNQEDPEQSTVELASALVDDSMRITEVSTLDDADSLTGNVLKSDAVLAHSSVSVEARKAILALRLGQVLESKVLELSVGTTELEEKLRQSVDNAISGIPEFILLDAAWGAGKTHALTILQALARSKKFATSFVVMDGVSTTLSNPMDLMSEVMSSIRFSDDPASCDLSYQLAKAKGQTLFDYFDRKGAHFIADTLRSLPDDAFLDPEAMDVITEYLSLRMPKASADFELQRRSYKPKLKTIKASKVEERAPRFVALLEEWAIFSSAMGCNGLLVILDELDVEYGHSAGRSKTDQDLRQRRKELLEQLGHLHDAPLILALAAAPGGDTDNEENDPVRDILKCFGNKMKHVTINPLSKSDFRALLDRLLNLYMQAYGLSRDSFSHEMTEKLFSDLFDRYQQNPNAVVRRFVRSAIESMDVYFVQRPTLCPNPLKMEKDIFSEL